MTSTRHVCQLTVSPTMRPLNLPADLDRLHRACVTNATPRPELDEVPSNERRVSWTGRVIYPRGA